MRRTLFIIQCMLTVFCLLSGCGRPQTVSQDSAEVPENASSASESISSSEEISEDSVLYDTSPISDAYLKGDTSSLDDFQLEIYNAAVTAIEESVAEGMTDYEKELAVHDYIVLHTQYDDVFLSALTGHTENSDNPYGTLITGRSICRGYTTTFQLLMDMLEIPCISISSEDLLGDEHAWNMVQIGGEWYYVDVTWDDPVDDVENRPVHHKYFNVTEEYMKIKHVWDDPELPKADCEEYSYISQNLTEVSEYSEIYDIMENALLNMNNSVYLKFADDLGISFDSADRPDDYIASESVSEGFADVISAFSKVHKNYNITCQRVENNGSVVLAVYMMKNK